VIAALFASVLAASSSAPCRTVHGQMQLWNGSPTVRISVIGAHRILGVVQPNQSFDDLPPAVRRIWDGKDVQADWGTAIVGDFTVCAVRPERPGHMQMVRLTATRHLVARPKP
jgi:hypothetical protein